MNYINWIVKMSWLCYFCRSRFPAQVQKPSSVEYVNARFLSVLTDSSIVFRLLEVPIPRGWNASLPGVNCLFTLV